MMESLIAMQLKLQARKNATLTQTGYATKGNVSLRWYPACARFCWFYDGEPVSKAFAVMMLEKQG